MQQLNLFLSLSYLKDKFEISLVDIQENTCSYLMLITMERNKTELEQTCADYCANSIIFRTY